VPDIRAYIDLAETHHLNSQQAIQNNNFDFARVSFLKCVESWKNVVKFNPDYEEHLKKAKHEYSEFVKTDPKFLSLFPVIEDKIRENPQILQTELYKLLPELSRSDISFVLYFAEEHSRISRMKKGRTYQLEIYKEIRFCQNCEKQVSKKYNFCSFCGANQKDL
jgi:hypothetical protein